MCLSLESRGEQALGGRKKQHVGADSRSQEVAVARSGTDRRRVSDRRVQAAAVISAQDAAPRPSEPLSSLHRSHQTRVGQLGLDCPHLSKRLDASNAAQQAKGSPRLCPHARGACLLKAPAGPATKQRDTALRKEGL